MGKIFSEEQLACDHSYVDVTEERRAGVERRELPAWAKILVEQKDRRWAEPKDRYKTLKYLKCQRCGLLLVKDEEAS